MKVSSSDGYNVLRTEKYDLLEICKIGRNNALVVCILHYVTSTSSNSLNMKIPEQKTLYIGST